MESERSSAVCGRRSTAQRRAPLCASRGNIKALLRRGRGYKDLRYLPLKAQRMAALRTEFIVMRKAA